MNKSESKYFNTALKMDRAFLEILEKKDFAYITVKEICEKAGVNRSTFYLHYETIGDLLSESVEYIISQFLEYMNNRQISNDIVTKLHSCSIDELSFITPKYLTPYLNYIKEHRRVFHTAVQNSETLRLRESYDKMFSFVFTPILERYRVPSKDRRYIMEFYINGLMAIIKEWMKEDCADETEHIIAVIQRCIPQEPSSVDKIFGTAAQNTP